MAILIRDYTSVYNINPPPINVKVGADQLVATDSVGTRKVIQAAPVASFEERLINVTSSSINVKVGADQLVAIDSVGTRKVIQAAPVLRRGLDEVVASQEGGGGSTQLQQWIG